MSGEFGRSVNSPPFVVGWMRPAFTVMSSEAVAVPLDVVAVVGGDGFACCRMGIQARARCQSNSTESISISIIITSHIILDCVYCTAHPGWLSLFGACRGGSACAGSCCCCCPSPLFVYSYILLAVSLYLPYFILCPVAVQPTLPLSLPPVLPAHRRAIAQQTNEIT